jgi:chromosome condensin MukBEF complex kleisin-like MukF subunit
MPILLDILAEKLGVARGELKELAADGKITSEVLKNALIDANEKLNESFEKTSVTIGQAMTVATNDFVKKYGEMDEVYEITNKTTTAIFTLKDGLIVLVDAVFYLVNVFSK